MSNLCSMICISRKRNVSFLTKNNSSLSINLLSPHKNAEDKMDLNTHIFVTPPTSNPNTIHSINEISNTPSAQKIKDDNSDIEKNRKTSFATGKFWFLKPGNLLAGASPYHTIAATTSNTFKTSPSTARLNNFDANTDSSRRFRSKKRKNVNTSITTQKASTTLFPTQDNQRPSRIRTTSLCDQKHDAAIYNSTSQNNVKKVACEVKQYDVDSFKTSPKLKKQTEIPSNFETSEAVFRLQELFSTTHNTHSNNSSTTSGEYAGVAYAASCIEAFAVTNPLNSRPNSRHQSPLDTNLSTKPFSKTPSYSTLVQSNSTPQLADFKEIKQQKPQFIIGSPSNSPTPSSTITTQKQPRRSGIGSSIYQKQSSPSPQRQDTFRLTTFINSEIKKSKSTTSFSQYQNFSPVNNKSISGNESVHETIPENDINNINQDITEVMKTKRNAYFYDGVVEDNDIPNFEEPKENFKMVAIRNNYATEKENLPCTILGNEAILLDSPEYHSYNMLDSEYSNLYEQIKWMYANWLYNSQLYLKHCEVINKVRAYPESYGNNNKPKADTKRCESTNNTDDKRQNNYTENLQIECSFLGSVNACCGFCGECYNLEAQCTGCHKPSLYCSICQMPVFGLASCCLRCNHGGHTLHIQEWFEERLNCDQIFIKYKK